MGFCSKMDSHHDASPVGTSKPASGPAGAGDTPGEPHTPASRQPLKLIQTPMDLRKKRPCFFFLKSTSQGYDKFHRTSHIAPAHRALRVRELTLQHVHGTIYTSQAPTWWKRAASPFRSPPSRTCWRCVSKQNEPIKVESRAPLIQTRTDLCSYTSTDII